MGTICETIFEACLQCYFNIKTGLLRKEKEIIGSLLLKRCSQNFISGHATIKSKYLIRKVNLQQIKQKTTYQTLIKQQKFHFSTR